MCNTRLHVKTTKKKGTIYKKKASRPPPEGDRNPKTLPSGTTLIVAQVTTDDFPSGMPRSPHWNREKEKVKSKQSNRQEQHAKSRRPMQIQEDPGYGATQRPTHVVAAGAPELRPAPHARALGESVRHPALPNHARGERAVAARKAASEPAADDQNPLPAVRSPCHGKPQRLPPAWCVGPPPLQAASPHGADETPGRQRCGPGAPHLGRGRETESQNPGGEAAVLARCAGPARSRRPPPPGAGQSKPLRSGRQGHGSRLPPNGLTTAPRHEPVPGCPRPLHPRLSVRGAAAELSNRRQQVQARCDGETGRRPCSIVAGQETLRRHAGRA